MGIESTTFRIADENATGVERGSILELEIRVHRKIEYTNGKYDHTYFGVSFRRDSADDDFRWQKTVDEAESGGMSDSHVVATHEAADHVEEHYGAGVDLGQLGQ